MSKFAAAMITDGKRFARGEQLLEARRILRVRDGAHHRKWRVMMLPGMQPSEEINAIRHLMKDAHITAVDKSEAALVAAADAGADEIIQHDLSDFQMGPMGHRSPGELVLSGGRFDLVLLDLCSNPNGTTEGIASAYVGAISAGGVMVFNFSYGRDVVEVANYQGNTVRRLAGVNEGADRLLKLTDNITLVGRIARMIPRKFWKNISSVIVYRGNQMPMCSILLSASGRNDAPSFVEVGAGDFEIAAAECDPALIYATPQERIDGLRRRHAAIKASYTRKAAA